jgi:hypothetical protein
MSENVSDIGVHKTLARTVAERPDHFESRSDVSWQNPLI